MACDHPNKFLSCKMVRVEHYCPDCKRTPITGCVPVPEEEYEELKKKAGMWETRRA